MRAALTCAVLIAGGAVLTAASDWALYRASIAAADGALRLHDTAAAASWLEGAPPASRGWEWRYLRSRLDNSHRSVQAHEAGITGVAMDLHGDVIASTSTDRTVRVWIGSTGDRLAVLNDASGPTWSPAFQPGETRLAAISSDGQLRVWDLAQLSEPAPNLTAVVTLPTGGRGLGATAWSPDGSLLAAATWSVEPGKGVQGWVHVWRFETRELLWKAQYGVKPIPVLAFRPDGAQLAAGTWDGWIGLFDVAGTAASGGAPKVDIHIPPIDGRYSAVQHLAYVEDPVVGHGDLVVASKDGLTRTYRSADGALRRELRGHTRWVNAVAGGREGHGFVATASSDQTIRLWGIQTTRAPRVLLGHRTAVTGLAMAHDRLISGDADGVLRWWDVTAPAGEPRSWQVTGNAIYGVAYSRDGRHMATASWRGDVSLRGADQGHLWSRRAHKESANAVAFSPDGTRMVTSGNDGRLIVHRVADGAELVTWDAAGGRQVTGLAWSPDGRTIASSASAPDAALWDATTGARLKTFAGKAGAMTAVAFSPDGRWLALTSANGDLRVVDVRTGDTRIASAAHAGGAQTVAFDPRGRTLATAGADRLIRVWSVPSLKPVRVLRGHAELIYGVTFSPDGARLASASSDQTVRLWSTATGESLLQIPFEDQVYGVCFTPDGITLAVLPMDGSVRLLGAPAYH